MISPGLSSCEHSLNTLRYADRVKELAATDPTEMKVSPSDEDTVVKIDEQANNSALSDSDLAQLRSLNVSIHISFHPSKPNLQNFGWRSTFGTNKSRTTDISEFQNFEYLNNELWVF